MPADIKYALRQFAKAPGFTLTAVLTLALGIGANTAIYSIIHGALRLPYPQSERIMAVQNVFPQGSFYAASYPDFIEWRAKATSFSQLVASFSQRATWNGAAFGKSEPESVSTGMASEGFFRMFGMKTIAGRDFMSAQHQQGAAQVCMLAESFWREELHGDPGVLGKSLDLDGKSCTVTGVMPAFMPEVYKPTQVWLPLETNKPWGQRGTNYLFVRGMLRPGATESHAQAELSTIQSQIDKQFPQNKHGVSVHPLSQAIFGDLRPIMQVLLAAVGFILLIACVNLANMLLARASDRAREFALRRALGAASARLVRQTLTESLLLSLGGAAAGLAVAVGLMHIPIAAWPKGFVAPSEVHLDGTILAFTAFLGVLAGVLFGIVPALRVVRSDERSALQPGRVVTESREHGRTRAVLMVSEIALSMLLVVGALNVAMHFASLLRVDPGVNPHDTMAITVSLSATQYPTADDQRRFYTTLKEKLATLPGVTVVGGGTDIPFGGSNANGDFEYEGQPADAKEKNPFADKHYVTPGYFAAVEATMWQGRDFSNQDRAGAPKVAIINRHMAQRLWPGQSALGKRIKSNGDSFSVVGVVNDIEFDDPGTPKAFQLYRPVDQVPPPSLSFVLRIAPGHDANPLSLAEPARAAVASIDPKLAISNVTSLDVLAQGAFAGQRTSTTVTSVLGVLALVLASIGVYGVMAYSVSRREREFGIRIALGADRGRIVRLLFSSVARLLAAGMALGIGLAYTGRAWIASMLGSQGSSPAAMVLGAVLLSAVAVIAAAVPVRRATRVQPVEALRNE